MFGCQFCVVKSRFRGYFRAVSRCFEAISGVFEGGFRDLGVVSKVVWVLFQGLFEDRFRVTWGLFQGYLRDILRIVWGLFQDLFEDIFRFNLRNCLRFNSRNYLGTAGMALRKVCVRDFGALVVRRFAYAKSFAYAIRVASKNRVAYAKSRHAKSRRVRKSRT